MMPYRYAMLFLGATMAMAGCSQKAQESRMPESGGLMPESAHVSGSPAAAVSNAGLEFSPSAGWISEPPSSSNRQAQYRLPRTEGDPEDAELAIYHFPGGGGTPQANVERWIGQFTRPDGSPASDTVNITHKSIRGIPVTVVDVSGTFAGSMMTMQKNRGSKANFRLLGAIAEAGNGLWFVKLTGPAKTVAKWQSSFESFLESIKPGK
jgi:hypothetical protein